MSTRLDGDDLALAPCRREPDAMVDLTGLTCPGPILGASEILEALRDGQVLLLLSDCPGTRDDLFAWARQTGNEVIHTESREDGSTGYSIRKGRQGAIAAHVRIDLRGVVCPGPVVEAKHVLNGMQRGEVLKLVSDCPGVREEMIGWARATGADLVAVRESGVGVHEFYLRRR